MTSLGLGDFFLVSRNRVEVLEEVCEEQYSGFCCFATNLRGFDQLHRVKSSSSVSAFIHVFVTVRSSSATILCKALERSESLVSTSVLGLGIDSPTWKNLSLQAHVEVSTQDEVLFGSPTHEFLDVHQNCLEFSQCLSFVRPSELK